MIRTYTMRLKITRKQSDTLQRLLAQLCELYNMALEQRRNAYKECGVSVYLYNQMLQLTELRAGVEEYKDFPVMIQRDPLRRLDRAFKAVFRRIKNGEKPGFPRFRSCDRYDSFSVRKEDFKFSNDSVVLPKLGVFRVKTRFRVRGIPVEFRVKRCGQKWQAQDN